MYKFIKIISQKICSMVFAFLVTGIVYLFLLGINDSFTKLIDLEVLGMMAVAFTGMIYVSPLLIFIGLPYSFLVDYVMKKRATHSAMQRLVLYILLVIVVVVATILTSGKSTSVLFVGEMGLAGAIGFWLGEIVFSKITKYVKENNLIKFTSNDM